MLKETWKMCLSISLSLIEETASITTSIAKNRVINGYLIANINFLTSEDFSFYL